MKDLASEVPERREDARTKIRGLLPHSVSQSVAQQASSAPHQSKHVGEGEKADSHSVIERITGNLTARRLLSSLLHPEEQVRERALEGLMRLVDDSKWDELLEFFEPLMKDLASEAPERREDARTKIRGLLPRSVNQSVAQQEFRVKDIPNARVRELSAAGEALFISTTSGLYRLAGNGLGPAQLVVGIPSSTESSSHVYRAGEAILVATTQGLYRLAGNGLGPAHLVPEIPPSTKGCQLPTIFILEPLGVC